MSGFLSSKNKSNAGDQGSQLEAEPWLRRACQPLSKLVRVDRGHLDCVADKETNQMAARTCLFTGFRQAGGADSLQDSPQGSPGSAWKASPDHMWWHGPAKDAEVLCASSLPVPRHSCPWGNSSLGTLPLDVTVS
jgi:hypothetical protein